MEWLHVRVVRGSQNALAKKNRIKSLQVTATLTVTVIILMVDVSDPRGCKKFSYAMKLEWP